MRRLAILALTLSAGCVSQYSQGPAWKPAVPPSGLSIVQVYRPQSSWGALSNIDVFLYGRHVSLCSGSYATFVVPPGKHTVDVAILAFGSAVLMNGFGMTAVASSATAANERTPVAIDVAPGGTAFVKVEFDAREAPPKAELVADGADDIEDLHLIPGGKGRWPVAFPPP